MKFHLLVYFLLASIYLQAQLPAFKKSYSIREQINYPSEVLQKGMNYLVTGITDSSTVTPDAFLMMVDTLGEQVFAQTYSNSIDGMGIAPGSDGILIADLNSRIIKADPIGNEMWNIPCIDYVENHDIESLSTGSFFIIGAKNPANNLHLAVSKYDQGGNLISEIIADTSFGYGTCLRLTSDKILYGCGAWLPDASYVDSASTFVFVADTNGVISWQRRYTELNNLVATEIEHTYDGGYLLYGSDVSINPTPICLIKLDTAGNVEWYKVYPDVFWGGTNGLEQDKSNYYFLGQKTLEPDTFLFIKTNLTGDIEASYPYAGIESCISRTSDSGFIMGAIERYLPQPNTNILLIKTDSSGKLVSSIGTDPLTSADLNIFPNPVSESLHLSFMPTPWSVNYEIYNLIGEKVSSGIVHDNKIIPISKLKNGPYLLSVFNKAFIKKIKFIKVSFN